MLFSDSTKNKRPKPLSIGRLCLLIMAKRILQNLQEVDMLFACFHNSLIANPTSQSEIPTIQILSGADYAENMVSNAAGIGSGWAGASAGAAIGTAIFPGLGTIIDGLIGGIDGGIGASSGSRKVTSIFRRKR